MWLLFWIALYCQVFLVFYPPLSVSPQVHQSGLCWSIDLKKDLIIGIWYTLGV